MAFAKVKYQFLAVISADLLVLGQGIHSAWYSPALPYLTSEHGPLLDGPLSTDMTGWIGAAISLGSLCGVLTFGPMSIWTGVKASILITAIPITIGWLLIIFGRYGWHLLISRFMSGLTIGGFYTIMPQFVAEISSDYIRGQMNSIMQVFVAIGMLIGYIGSSYIPYTINPLAMITVPIVAAVLFWFMPESPQHLLRHNKPKDAEKSLRFYRNCRVGGTDEVAEDELKAEFGKFTEIARRNESRTPLTFSDFTSPNALRTLMVCPILMAVNQFSGAFAITTYAVTVFKSGGSTLDPDVSAIIMQVVKVCGTCAASQMVDRLGRKVLLLVSTSVGCVSLLIAGTFEYLVVLGWHPAAWNWIPLVTISVFIFTAAIGILPVPYVMISEVLSPKLRPVGATICTCVAFVCQSIMLKTMPVMLESMQLFGTMYFFAAVLFSGFAFTVVVVTETKGMNLDVLDEKRDGHQANVDDSKTGI